MSGSREAALALVSGHVATLRDDARAMEATVELFRPEFEACWARNDDGSMGKMIAPERALQLRPFVLTTRDEARCNRKLADAIEKLVASAGETRSGSTEGDSAVAEGQAPDLEAALEYLSPHPLTADTASISLSAGKMRQAIDSIRVALAESERKRAADRTALAALYEWYDRDGSVGGANDVFAEHRNLLTPTQETSNARG